MSDLIQVFPVDGPAWYDDWHEAMRGTVRHHAQDLFAPRGTRVVAPARMMVEGVGVGTRAGLYVYARNRSVLYYFSHLQRTWAKKGQWLEAGQAFAEVGDSGNAADTRPHLHFAVRVDGRPVNTYPWLVALQPPGPSGIREAPEDTGPPPEILDRDPLGGGADGC